MEFITITEHKRKIITEEWFDPRTLPPTVKDYLTIEYDPEYGQLAIDAHSYTGIIPIGSDHAIRILPKSGLKNLTYMLFRSGLLTRSLETPFDETVTYQIPDDDLESFFEGLVHSFLVSLDLIKSLGILRTTVKEEKNAYTIKGRVNFREWMQQYPTNFGIPIPQTTFSSNINNFANRILRWCLEYLLTSPLQHISKGEILDRIDYFGKIPVVQPTNEDLRALDYKIETSGFPSSR